jgi:hypothetical protein
VTISRQTVRDYLQGLLAAVLVPSLAQQVYAWQTADFTQSPLVTISGSGIGRKYEKIGANSAVTDVNLNVHTFVRYAIPETGWTEHDAENAIDALEVAIFGVVIGHRGKAQDGSAPWDLIEYGAPSKMDAVAIRGIEYRRETIPIHAKVVNG